MSKRSDWVESNKTQEGVKLGMVSPAMFMDYVRYKEYLDNLQKGLSRGQAIQKAADYLTVHRRTVERAVIFFED
jgi:hypothetical protein